MNTYEKFYYGSLNKEEHFINRVKIREELIKVYEKFNIDNSNLFEVYYVYGFGGMGKSHLLKYLRYKFKETLPESMQINISFEIQENTQIIYGLTKIRKSFNHPCPLFDFALLYYWDQEHIERLNDDFAKLLKNDLLSSFSNIFVYFTIGDKSPLPSFGDIQNIVNSIDNKWRNLKIKNVIQEIQEMDSDEILESLPVFLAMDIKNYMESHNTNFIFILDSYQQSNPYSESLEWLFTFINTLHKGFFIITGREKLNWLPVNYDIHSYHIESYPIEEAKKFLINKIGRSRMDIIETILKSTDCIPIYISLAIDIYEKEQNITMENLIAKSKFTDRHMLVKHFINHLNSNWQDMILSLSVIRIFNNNIFNFLIDDLNLPCAKTDYDDIVQISLLSYTEHTENLYKIHDVFCANALLILQENKKSKIFRSYLSYLAKREIYALLSTQQVSSAITLLQNVINLEINYFEKSLDKDEIEYTIDIFLMIYNTRAIFTLPKPASTYTLKINDLLYLMDSVLYEKESTYQTAAKLKSIINPSNFGKHIISYNIMLNYTLSLRGNYEGFKAYLESQIESFTNNDKKEWYYLKTYIYLIDYYIMEGQFLNAYSLISEEKEIVSSEAGSIDDCFLLQRLEGHLWRFNYNFDKASKIYNELLEKYADILSLKVYLLTNLCETMCFVEPDYVIAHFQEVHKYTKQFHNLKNEAKLYYSRGIAYTLQHKYDKAIKDINTSIQLNKEDGYKSGELFAYVAKGFWEYASKNSVGCKTIAHIKEIINANKVYDFLLYPFYLIKQDNELKPSVCWIDENFVFCKCKDLLSKFNPKKHL